MKKTLLILENDSELSSNRHDYVLNFKKKWEGDVIELTRLKSRSREEIYKAVMECSTIAVQTCFVNGSDIQFFEMLQLLSKIPDTKEIYIYLMGDELEDYFLKNLEDKDFYAIKHHNIWEMSDGCDYEWSKPHRLLDFSKAVNRYSEVLRLAEEKRIYEEQYAKSSNERKTGRKIKILGCNASGEQFNSLTIGEIVDELDMSETDPNKGRGVWVWGKSEAVKLVNDCRMIEYEVVSTLTSKDVLDEIGKSTAANLKIMKGDQYQEFITLITKRVENTHDIAQHICDELGIERRGNRSRINHLIQKYYEQFK